MIYRGPVLSFVTKLCVYNFSDKGLLKFAIVLKIEMHSLYLHVRSCDDHYILYMKKRICSYMTAPGDLKRKIYVQKIKFKLLCVCKFGSFLHQLTELSVSSELSMTVQ